MLLESALADLSHPRDSTSPYPGPPDWDEVPVPAAKPKVSERAKGSSKSGELGRGFSNVIPKSGRSGELGRGFSNMARSGELGRPGVARSGDLLFAPLARERTKSGEMTMGTYPTAASRRSGELRKGGTGTGPSLGALAAAAPRLSKSVSSPADRSRDPPMPLPQTRATSVRTAAHSNQQHRRRSSSPGQTGKSQHARSHARFQPNLETQDEHSEEEEDDEDEEDGADLASEEDPEQGLEEVEKDVIVQSNSYVEARMAQIEAKSSFLIQAKTGFLLGPDPDRELELEGALGRLKEELHRTGRDEVPEKEIRSSKEPKIELDLDVGAEILTARLSKSGELKNPARTDSGNRRSGAVPFKWEQEPGVSKYKEEEPGFMTTVGGKTISLSGPLTPPPGVVAAAAAAARAAMEKDAAAAKEKSITDKMRSILAGKFSGQLKPPLPPPPPQPAPAPAPPPKAKRVSFYETDVVVTFDNGEEESSPVSILDRPESPTSPPYSPPQCPAPHGPSPQQSPAKKASAAPSRRPGSVGGVQMAQHLVTLTGMDSREDEHAEDERERENNSADDHESDQDALWDDAGEELSEPSSWGSNASVSRRVHPVPSSITKNAGSTLGGSRTRRKQHTNSWSAGSPSQTGQESLDTFDPDDADLSDLEYETRRMRGINAKARRGSTEIGKPPRPSSRQMSQELYQHHGKPPRQASGELGLTVPGILKGGSRQVSGELGAMQKMGSRHVSGELGMPVPGILKTGGSRQVSGELGMPVPGILKTGGSRQVSGELGRMMTTQTPIASHSRPVSGELGRVQISTRPTTGSLSTSPDRDVFHTAPTSRAESRKNSGELTFGNGAGGTSSGPSSPTSGYGGKNSDRSAPVSSADEQAESDREMSALPGSGFKKVRNPFGSLKGEPMIKNGRIIYAGDDGFDEDDFSFEERADEVVHSVDESLYAISPIASTFVFPGSAGSTPSASPQVHVVAKLSSSASQKNSGMLDVGEAGSDPEDSHIGSGSSRNLSFGPRLTRSGTVSVHSTRHTVNNSFDESKLSPSNVLNGGPALLRRLSNVEAEIDKPRSTAMNCAMACLPFRSLLGFKSSTPAISRRGSRLSITNHSANHSRERDPFEDRLRAP